MSEDRFKEVIEKVWPKTRKELEKAIDNAKMLIDKGEDHLKVLSEKSAEKTKKMALSLRREKVYYALGKAIATTPKTKWAANKKVHTCLAEIKLLEREIKKIK